LRKRCGPGARNHGSEKTRRRIGKRTSDLKNGGADSALSKPPKEGDSPWKFMVVAGCWKELKCGHLGQCIRWKKAKKRKQANRPLEGRKKTQEGGLSWQIRGQNAQVKKIERRGSAHSSSPEEELSERGSGKGSN